MAPVDSSLPLHERSLVELAAALTSGSVSSVEATEHALGRIARLDRRDGLNAYLLVTDNEARAAAMAADARRARGEARGPLDGVPLALKDLFDTAGIRTTAGSLLFADRVPDRDATVVQKLLGAGMVMLGKTNMLEFAYGYPHPEIGETANPWNLSRTAGGSSGGSAAAVAAGLAWGALGSDTGGSIRSPAAYCGITGLKPSYGLVSLAGVVPLSWSLDHAGPMARTAADCALLLTAIGGHDPVDPTSASPAEVGSVMADIARLADDAVSLNPSPPSLAGQRIGVVSRLLDLAERATPGMLRQIEGAMATFRDLGAEVVTVDLPASALPRAVAAVGRIYAVEAAAYHRAWLPDRAERYGPVIRAGLEAALTVPAVDYVASQRDRLEIATIFTDFYREVDLLAWPAQPLVAPPLGTSADQIVTPEASAPTIEVEIGTTGFANLTGEPSISLPCGLIDGLPVGLLLQAPRFADARLVGAAMAYQNATGIPPLAPFENGSAGGK